MLKIQDLRQNLTTLKPLITQFRDLQKQVDSEGKSERRRLGSAGLCLKADLATKKLGTVFACFVESQDQFLSEPFTVDLEQTLIDHSNTGKSELDNLPDELLIPVAEVTLILSEIYKARVSQKRRYAPEEQIVFLRKSNAYERIVSSLLERLSENAFQREQVS